MIFAQIKNSKIINSILLGEYNEVFLQGYDSLIRIDNITPQPSLDWTYDGVSFSPPNPTSTYSPKDLQCITFNRSGNITVGSYLYLGSSPSNLAGFVTNGSNIITKMIITNSSIMASGKSATFRLQKRTGVATFIDIEGSDITIPALEFTQVVNNLNISIGPDWEISAYRINPDNGNGTAKDILLNILIVGS